MFCRPLPAPLVAFAAPQPAAVWLVVFLDPPPVPRNAPLPNRLLGACLKALRPGFRHVLALSPAVRTGAPGREWLIFNPGARMLAVGLAPSHETLRTLRRLIARGRARCRVAIAREPATVRPRGLFTCVQAVAHLTGTGCHPFTTPHGLWRRMGAMRPGDVT